MTENQRVFEVSVTGHFYLMADNWEDAQKRAEALCAGLEDDIPGGRALLVSVYEIKRQDDYMRSQCINAEEAL